MRDNEAISAMNDLNIRISDIDALISFKLRLIEMLERDVNDPPTQEEVQRRLNESNRKLAALRADRDALVA
ncbi:hypothetical protein A2U01_0086693 [Trifolium medium]|uniref:Uncharacterized protein n=1 Tax=Trifolium medium TaxID=97028 RepID=A0A392U018_9FABA|nr:hypothetical protein [Trifolium medium]